MALEFGVRIVASAFQVGLGDLIRLIGTWRFAANCNTYGYISKIARMKKPAVRTMFSTLI